VLHSVTWHIKPVTLAGFMCQVGLAACLGLCACGGKHVATQAEPPVTDVGHGLSVRLPDGWRVATTSLTPHLLDPREEMSVGTFPLRYRPGLCAQFPSGTLEDLGPRDAFVTLQERGRDPGSGWPDFPPRPARFGRGFGGASEVEACVKPARFTDHWFGFTDGGRHFNVLVVFGLEASPQVEDQAWAILDSLRVDPKVQPDWHASP
jgi:hypothetical protein